MKKCYEWNVLAITKLITIFFLFTLFLNCLSPLNQVYAADDSQYFAATGYTVRGKILQYWQSNGGLPVFGYPITEPTYQTDPQSGQTFLAQWFERFRLEYHPENAGTEYEILLGLLGVDLNRNRLNSDPNFVPAAPINSPNVPADQQRYFQETKHNLRLRFLRYWQQNGGLKLFGFPISEEFAEIDPQTGKAFIVQWFERTRLEYHPENQAPYDVLPGLVSKQFTDSRRKAVLQQAYEVGFADTKQYQTVATLATRTNEKLAPNGNLLAYVDQGSRRNNKLVVRTLEPSKETVIANQVRPFVGLITWSPDSSSFLYVTTNEDDTPEINLATLDGKAPRKLADGFAPVWSPDSNYIAFYGAPFVGSSLYGGGDGGQLTIMRADGSQQRQLQNAGELRPSWQPIFWSYDAKRIAAGSWLLDVATGNKIIRGPNSDDPSNTWDFGGIQYLNPDGKSFAYWRNLRFETPNDKTKGTFSSSDELVMVTDSGQAQTIFRSLPRTCPCQPLSGLIQPIFSPDSSKFLLVTYQNGSGEIRIYNKDGSVLRSYNISLFAILLLQTYWAPNSQEILFTLGDRFYFRGAWWWNLAETTPHELTGGEALGWHV